MPMIPTDQEQGRPVPAPAANGTSTSTPTSRAAASIYALPPGATLVDSPAMWAQRPPLNPVSPMDDPKRRWWQKEEKLTDENKKWWESVPFTSIIVNGQKYDSSSNTVYGRYAEATYNKYLTERALRKETWGDPAGYGPGGEPYWLPDANKPGYLGVNAGYIWSPSFDQPAADAPLSVWEQAITDIGNSTSAPLYTVYNISDEFLKMSREDVIGFQKSMLAAGKYAEGDAVTFGQVSEIEYGMMQNLMERANMNGTDWAFQFDSVVAQGIEYQKQMAAAGGGYGGGGGTITDVQYDTSSFAEARSLLVGIMTNMLGRYPTDEEVSNFLIQLNKAEAKSPTTTVTTTSGETRTTRMTPTSVDPNMLAEDFVKGIDGGKPAAAGSADMYINALIQSLGG